MKQRDLANLLNRAAAALETPNDLTWHDKMCLVEDLTCIAEAEKSMTEAKPYILVVSSLLVFVGGLLVMNVLIALGVI